MKDKHKKHNAETTGMVESEKKIPELPVEDSMKGDKTDGIKVEAEKKTEPQMQDVMPVDTTKVENDEKYLRLFADFDNFRKRTIRERTELYQRANEEIIEEILPVLDHLELALKSATEHKIDAGVLDGFRLVAEQLLTALKKSGLSPVDAGEGVQFDPLQHEAISHMSSDAIPENAVITQVRRGYVLGGKMLRAVRVVVSSGKPVQSNQNCQPEASQEGNKP
ncbi:MAG: nucleotide exchange factor GrpE [Kiritimatiellae bacterium]|nr:nucleotide exchange factor GrpE [Kiritimatiellia bacterium]MDD5520760.1 nucleotide exchange factor GrpE [Kiritimatiellia bacterium]